MKLKQYKTDVIDLKYLTPRSVVEQIQAAFEKYGEEHVNMDVGIGGDYGGDVAYCELHCKRALTEQELEWATKLQKDNELKTLQREREMYTFLKKKFEKNKLVDKS